MYPIHYETFYNYYEETHHRTINIRECGLDVLMHIPTSNVDWSAFVEGKAPIKSGKRYHPETFMMQGQDLVYISDDNGSTIVLHRPRLSEGKHLHSPSYDGTYLARLPPELSAELFGLGVRYQSIDDLHGWIHLTTPCISISLHIIRDVYPWIPSGTLEDKLCYYPNKGCEVIFPYADVFKRIMKQW